MEREERQQEGGVQMAEMNFQTGPGAAFPAARGNPWSTEQEMERCSMEL
ncbi:MAG: hypothetical protein LUG90_20935 [Clostridiaceae bacterium]|nr:hypothetical protein [Clostridiaceae bacterium]